MERVLRTALERNTLEGLADLLRDAFTGLYNRDGIMTLGTRALETAARTGGTLVLLCARIENLDVLHQDLGPASSGQAIREITEILRSCFRRSDLLGRLGTGEFCALAVDAAEPSAPILLQRVRSRLNIVNRDRRACGDLGLRLRVGYWSANDPRTFSEFLDAVECELRRDAAAPEPHLTGSETVRA
jgi:diguanylate cyclase (GGDEF)-like protein